MSKYRRKSDRFRNKHLQTIYDIDKDDNFLIDLAFRNTLKIVKASVSEMSFDINLGGTSHPECSLNVNISELMGRYICIVSINGVLWRRTLGNFRICPDTLKEGFIDCRSRIVEILKGINRTTFTIDPFKKKETIGDVEILPNLFASNLLAIMLNGLDVADLRQYYIFLFSNSNVLWKEFVLLMEYEGYEGSLVNPEFYINGHIAVGASKDPKLHTFSNLVDFVHFYKALDIARLQLENKTNFNT